MPSSYHMRSLRDVIGHETATLPAIRGIDIEPVHARACTAAAVLLRKSDCCCVAETTAGTSCARTDD
jgi:hypothetical protein